MAGVLSGAGADEELSPTIEAWFGLSENAADTISIGIVVLPLTYCTVVVGELVPKTLALKHALSFVLRAAPWLAFSDKILCPLVTVLIEDILEEIVGDIYDEDDEGTLRRILSTSTKARRHWPQNSLDPSRRHPS